MDDAQDVPKRGKGWAFVTSTVLHAVIAAMLLLKWPETKLEPPKDEAVKVDIVQDKDAPKPPEQKAEEQQPPPPPPPPQEQAKTEQPPNVPVPTLRPVFQFGQKNEGPAQQDGSASDGEKDAADELADKKPDAPKAEEPKAVTEEASKEPPKDDLPGVPDILKALEQQETASAAAAGKPVEEKAQTPKPADAKELKKAKKLYSPDVLGGTVAISAMNGLTRSQRIKQLCVSETVQQLAHTTPPYYSYAVFSSGLREGNVLYLPGAFFRTRDGWFEISYRCEVDDDATKVVSYAFQVGNSIPRPKWSALGLPAD